MPSRNAGVYFVDGASPRGDLVGVVAYLYELSQSDAEFSRLYTVKNGSWSHFEINSQIVSVVFRTDNPSWWLLGKRGDITVIEPNGRWREQLPDAGTGKGKFGYVDKIATINGELYVCGYQRQVYRRNDAGWARIDQDIRCVGSAFGIGFTSIDGLSKSDLYAVGRRGEIYHYDGRRWTACTSPTNVHLRDVRCVRTDLVYIVGNNGVLLRGADNNWEVVVDEEFPYNLWAVEYFRGAVYVASSYGIARLDGDVFQMIDTGYSMPTNGYKLSKSGEAMWSIGTDELLRFDGSVWQEFPCPDNP